MGSFRAMGAYAVALVCSLACESTERAGSAYATRSSLVGDVAPVLGPEVELPSTDVAALTEYGRNPAAASDGRNWLVVWQERNDVKGARIDANGKRVEAEPTLLWQGQSVWDSPSVAFGAQRYFVVVADADVLRGVFVSPISGVVDSSMVIESARAQAPTVAFGGSSFLVAWTVYASGAYHVSAKRVASDGQVLDTTPISVGEAPGPAPPNISIAPQGSSYFVAWEGVLLARIRETGGALAVDAVTQPASGRAPRVACTGTDCLATWTSGEPYCGCDCVSGPAPKLLASRLGAKNGKLLDDPARIVEDWDATASVSAAGGDFLVVRPRYPWISESIVASRLLSASGGESEVQLVQTEPFAHGSLALSASQSSVLLAWHRYLSTGSSVLAKRLAFDASSLDTEPIAVSRRVGAGQHGAAAIASNGVSYLAAWEDYRSGGWDVRLARFDAAGVLLDPEGIALPPARLERRGPVVATYGSGYVVAWIEDEGWSRDFGTRQFVRAARVSSEGAVLDAQPLLVGTGPSVSSTMYSLALASDGTSVLAVWSAERELCPSRTTEVRSLTAPSGRRGPPTRRARNRATHPMRVRLTHPILVRLTHPMGSRPTHSRMSRTMQSTRIDPTCWPKRPRPPPRAAVTARRCGLCRSTPAMPGSS
jgi:hypothetical protein